MEEESQLCTVCSVPCTQSCGKCKNVYYCSKEHQANHWKEHKKDCHPFKIVTHPDKGRILIATKDMAPYSIIIQESSIINLPTDKVDEELEGKICVSCCRVALNLESCSKCSSPVCGRDCEMATIHADYECKVLPKEEEALCECDRLTLTSVIRCLLLKYRNREKYDALMTLQSNKEHFYKDKNAVEKITSASSTVPLLLEPIGDFNQDEVATVVGIIDTNALVKSIPIKPSFISSSLVSKVTDDIRRLMKTHLVKDMGRLLADKVVEAIKHSSSHYTEELKRIAIDMAGKRRSSMHLYAKTSIASHSCVPNARPIIQSSGRNGRMKLIATRPIVAGEEITIAYTDLRNGTLERQKRLWSYYYFSCKCTRCQDPTELGTNFSSVKCRQCPDGYLLPKYQWDSIQDLETEEVLWMCNGCSNQNTDAQIQELLASLKNELYEVPAKSSKGMKTVRKMEAVIDKYSGDILHPNHYKLFSIEDSFTLTTNIIIKLGQFSPQEIQHLKKISVAKGRKLLEICDKLFPGPTEIRGQVLYLLWKGMQDDAYNQKMETFMSTPQEQTRVIPDFIKEHMMTMAEEAVQILSLEPDVVEYQCWVKELKGWIEQFQLYF